MARFAYQAKGMNGKEVKGEIEAGTEQEARIKLRAQRLVPLKVVERSASNAAAKNNSFFAPRAKPKDLQIMTRQLATLVGSGVPIMQAIDVLARGTRSPALNTALSGVVNSISQGRRLGDAMADHPKVFDRFYCNMVRAGEESGNLDQILNRLAMYIEKSVKIKGKVKGAMAYPAVIIVVAFIVVAALLVFVIPKFQELFKSSGGDLPALTKFVIKLSEIFQAYWWAGLFSMVGLVMYLKYHYETEPGRQQIDTFLIKLPLMGDLIQKSAIARLTRTLSTLLGSGVGIMEALDIGSKVVGNYVMELVIARARQAITEGKSLTVPLAKEKYMPDMVTQMIGVGEQTGNLDQMLSRIADFYEDEVDVAVGALTSVIEPMLMVFLGVIIAFLVVSMYLPIFNLADSAGH
jgi:type IV pilus assembly protein PilC